MSWLKGLLEEIESCLDICEEMDGSDFVEKVLDFVDAFIDECILSKKYFLTRYLFYICTM